MAPRDIYNEITEENNLKNKKLAEPAQWNKNNNNNNLNNNNNINNLNAADG